MDRLDNEELKEWSQNQPLSILRLDPIDRAILKISGSCAAFTHLGSVFCVHSGNSLIITLLCKVLRRFFFVISRSRRESQSETCTQTKAANEFTCRGKIRGEREEENNNKMRVAKGQKIDTKTSISAWCGVAGFPWCRAFDSLLSRLDSTRGFNSNWKFFPSLLMLRAHESSSVAMLIHVPSNELLLGDDFHLTLPSYVAVELVATLRNHFLKQPNRV